MSIKHAFILALLIFVFSGFNVASRLFSNKAKQPLLNLPETTRLAEKKTTILARATSLVPQSNSVVERRASRSIPFKKEWEFEVDPTKIPFWPFGNRNVSVNVIPLEFEQYNFDSLNIEIEVLGENAELVNIVKDMVIGFGGGRSPTNSSGFRHKGSISFYFTTLSDGIKKMKDPNHDAKPIQDYIHRQISKWHHEFDRRKLPSEGVAIIFENPEIIPEVDIKLIASGISHDTVEIIKQVPPRLAKGYIYDASLTDQNLEGLYGVQVFACPKLSACLNQMDYYKTIIDEPLYLVQRNDHVMYKIIAGKFSSMEEAEDFSKILRKQYRGSETEKVHLGSAFVRKYPSFNY